MDEAVAEKVYTDWPTIIGALEPIPARLMEKWGRQAPGPHEHQDLDRLVLSAVAGAYLSHVHLDPARPVWSPLWNPALNMAGPNPDYVYMVTDIDPRGTYRISGYRGTSRFVEISQSGWEMLGAPTAGGPRARLPTHDLDTLQIAADGSFSVTLSRERPAGHAGDWWKLEPGCIKLLARKCSCDWHREIDARLAIVRLDDTPPISREDLSRRMANVPKWVEAIIAFDIDLAHHYRSAHGVNSLQISQKMKDGGGLADQLYYDAWYEFGDDEALILDTALPQQYRYWQTLVADDRFSTVEWVYRKSSINDVQAHIDDDGRFRAVVAARDPGVPNWLDKANNPSGILQLRLNRASPIPDPVLKKVPFAEIANHLPASTPRVSPAERAEALRRRAATAQTRIYW
jgi:hypothetical protein